MKKKNNSSLLPNANIVELSQSWMKERGWTPLPFQLEAWKAYQSGAEGLVNAPTGSGKTYSLLLPALIRAGLAKDPSGLRIVWITPIRALAKEILQSAQRVIQELQLPITAGIRTGDTTDAERSAQKKAFPQLLITTPESLHLLLAAKNASSIFANLDLLVADEWHELLSSKRGVMLELANSRLRAMSPLLKIWGISATIGNLEQALEVLVHNRPGIIVRAAHEKKIEIVSIMPEEAEKMPWAGHLGIKMLHQVVPIINQSKSTLLFTNTRAQCEIWYRHILEHDLSLSGIIAMHHGSISKDLRHWVEDAISDGRLKAVVCTSSLDLGVDFAPVETIVQIGGPKGVARFLQRAGRSGHRPDALSRIYFLPTHSLELIEAAALREAVKTSFIENREPIIRAFDVLIQYLVTLSVGEGFDANTVFEEIKNTYCFSTISLEEWKWIIYFTSSGGDSLSAYPDYNKLILKEGKYHIANQRLARRHRMSIGAIVGDTMMMIKYKRGGLIGHVEESFIASLNEGDAFWFAGLGLELIQVKELTAYVKKSEKMTGKIPSWQGGTLPLSSRMSHMIRRKLTEVSNIQDDSDPELFKIIPIIDLQRERSHVPGENEFLIEIFESKDGHHAMFYPFEGRAVHQGLASLFAYRIGKLFPISLSLAYNDYGFELLSDQRIPIEEALGSAFTDVNSLERDMLAGVNATELAKRKFRDIAAIAGLIFKGFPGQQLKDRHLQSSSQLIFKVFEDYDPYNLLYKQSYEEVLQHQLELPRLRTALDRINSQKIILKYPEKPTPFAFPIMVDRLREKMTSETLEERVGKMSIEFEQ
ncbi:MAG: ligase-associated DNA damage response DEXH box helicase [Flavobacteriales bacterium]|jgi:ATP-dependent Lhr-like helicase